MTTKSATRTIFLFFSASIFLILFPFKSNGKPSSDAALYAYVDSLKAGDSKRIKQLVPESYTSDSEIREKLNQFNDCKIENVNPIKSEWKPGQMTAQLTGVCDRNGTISPFRDTLHFRYIGGGITNLFRGRWYLIMGTPT